MAPPPHPAKASVRHASRAARDVLSAHRITKRSVPARGPLLLRQPLVADGSMDGVDEDPSCPDAEDDDPSYLPHEAIDLRDMGSGGRMTRASTMTLSCAATEPHEDPSCESAEDDDLSYHLQTVERSDGNNTGNKRLRERLHNLPGDRARARARTRRTIKRQPKSSTALSGTDEVTGPSRQTQERFLVDSMGQANHAPALTGNAALRPTHDPLAWPNELRRAEGFYPHFRKRVVKKLFHPSNPDPRRLSRTILFTTDELLNQTIDQFNGLDLEIVDHDLKLLDSNGHPLLYFIKGGLNHPFNYQHNDFAKDPSLTRPDLEAIGQRAYQNLTATYPPPHAKSNDSRHNENRECNQAGVQTGLYHFAFWQMSGHDWVKAARHTVTREGFMSADCYPKMKDVGGVMKGGGCVSRFFQDMAPITQAIGSLFEVLDPVNYNRYKRRYDELVAVTPLSTLNFSRHACFTGHACLVGLLTGLHRDSRDTSDGWVLDICFGDFDGGNLEVPQAGVALKLRGGDALFMRSKILIHGVSHVSRGIRYSQVSFTHHGQIDTVADVAERG